MNEITEDVDATKPIRAWRSAWPERPRRSAGKPS
jgi:hypothetical protein